MLGPDALIHTLIGPRLVSDLVGVGPTYVFTWDGDRVTVGEIEVLGIQTLDIPYRIDLDDETGFNVCKESLILLRSGAPRYLDQIKSGTSLLPLYTKLDAANYPVYQEPGDWHKEALTASDKNRWRRVSRMVAEWKLGRRCESTDVVSYISKDRLNCHPKNL